MQRWPPYWGPQEVRCGPTTCAPAAPAFHGLHCLPSSPCAFVAVAQFMAQSSNPYLPDWSKLLVGILVLGFIARSHYCLGLSRGLC